MIEKLNTTIEKIPFIGERFLANKINEIIDTLNKLTKEEESLMYYSGGIKKLTEKEHKILDDTMAEVFRNHTKEEVVITGTPDPLSTYKAKLKERINYLDEYKIDIADEIKDVFLVEDVLDLIDKE